MIPRKKGGPCLQRDRIILPTLMLTVSGKQPEGVSGRRFFFYLDVFRSLLLTSSQGRTITTKVWNVRNKT